MRYKVPKIVTIYDTKKIELLSFHLLIIIFGKIFGKFCKTFEGSKPLFIFGPVSTIEIPNFRNFGKVESPKIFFQRIALITIVIEKKIEIKWHINSSKV
jgi:hypothetical protein